MMGHPKLACPLPVSMGTGSSEAVGLMGTTGVCPQGLAKTGEPRVLTSLNTERNTVCHKIEPKDSWYVP